MFATHFPQVLGHRSGLARQCPRYAGALWPASRTRTRRRASLRPPRAETPEWPGSDSRFACHSSHVPASSAARPCASSRAASTSVDLSPSHSRSLLIIVFAPCARVLPDLIAPASPYAYGAGRVEIPEHCAAHIAGALVAGPLPRLSLGAVLVAERCCVAACGRGGCLCISRPLSPWTNC